MQDILLVIQEVLLVIQDVLLVMQEVLLYWAFGIKKIAKAIEEVLLVLHSA
jgi:hypothetical protein